MDENPNSPRMVLEFGPDGIGMLNINGENVVAKAMQFQITDTVPRLIVELTLLDIDVKLGTMKIAPH